MAVAANEPYQRVSKDNGVFDGALIGMAVGAGGAGAGVFGTRMNYNGIDKRAKNRLSALENQENQIKNKMNTATNNYEKKMAKKSNPNIFEKKKYNKAQQQIDDMTKDISSQVEQANHERQILKNANRKDSVNRVNQEVDTQGEAIKKRFNNPNAKPDYEQIRHQNPNVHQQRNQHVKNTNKIDSYYDDRINNIRQQGAEQIKFSDARATTGEIEDKIANRQNKVQKKYNKTMSGHQENLLNIAEKKRNFNPDTMKKNHAYSKHMGGWKNTAIIGASAVVGGGVGAISDGLYS